jgi:tyrosinase
MLNFTRRSFIAGTAAIPFSVWLERNAMAQAPFVRYDARSTQGQAMLKAYAQAVAKMKAIREDDPRGWLFQWYTHWVKQPTVLPAAQALQAKSDEIARVFPSGGANRDLAQDMWDTCQAHRPQLPDIPMKDEPLFLPWHRMFVYFFERIIRSVSGVADFTLPYWNYSTMDATRGVIPPEFRMQGDATFGSLYIKERNLKSDQGADVNAGDPIQDDSPIGGPGDPLNLDALTLPTYYETDPPGGFCDQLDGKLHGNVHSLVGNLQNMGIVPTSARDPIFWMHHCNIDRLWASWNAGGGANPTFSQQFVFADENGQRVQLDASGFTDIAALGYSYDRLEPVPAASRPRADLVAATRGRKTHAATRAAAVSFGDGPVAVTLEPLPEAAGAAALDVTARVRALPPEQREYLVVHGLHAMAPPGVTYGVYLDLPPNPTRDQLAAHRIGTVNFFHAVHPDAEVHGPQAASKIMPAAEPGMFVSFDITDVAKSLLSKGLLREKPILTIIPQGKPAAGAKATVREISLVQM